MVLWKIDKYYNQVKFQVVWPRLKVGSSTVMFIQLEIFKSRRQKTSERLIVDQNLLEGSSKSFFAHLPSIAGCIARSCSLGRKNCPVSEV